MGPQQQADDPDRRQGLQDDDRPKVERPAGGEKKPVSRRAARHQIAFEPARQISAGVVFQERQAIPQCRQQQNKRRGNRGTRSAERGSVNRSCANISGPVVDAIVHRHEAIRRGYPLKIAGEAFARSVHDRAKNSRFLWHFAGKGAFSVGGNRPGEARGRRMMRAVILGIALVSPRRVPAIAPAHAQSGYRSAGRRLCERSQCRTVIRRSAPRGASTTTAAGRGAFPIRRPRADRRCAGSSAK